MGYEGALYFFCGEGFENSINRLSQLMPNIGGPKEDRRNLYSAVIHSILLYAAPVWAEEIGASRAKKELLKLQNVQKQIGARVISSYRTVALIAVLVLARIFPIELQAGILRKLYLKKKEFLEMGTVDALELQKYQKLLTEDASNKWKSKLNKLFLSGKRIRAAILPQLSRWFNRTHKGCLTYRTTQLMTGHGCFADFLHRIGKYATPNCGFCNEGIDNAQHTLQYCSKWEEEKSRLRNQIGEDLSLQTVVSRILQSRENLLAFQDFAETVMTKKENKEREEEETNCRTQHTGRNGDVEQL